MNGINDIAVFAEIDSHGDFNQTIRVPLKNQFVHYAYDDIADLNDIGEYDLIFLPSTYRENKICHAKIVEDRRIEVENNNLTVKKNEYIFYNSPKSTALLKLPEATKKTRSSQPAKLPTDCGNDLENVPVTAVGTGRSSFFHSDWETGLRHVHLQTLTNTECKQQSRHLAKSEAIMCTKSIGGQTTFSGDSGNSQNRSMRQMTLSAVFFFWTIFFWISRKNCYSCSPQYSV